MYTATVTFPPRGADAEYRTSNYTSTLYDALWWIALLTEHRPDARVNLVRRPL